MSRLYQGSSSSITKYFTYGDLPTGHLQSTNRRDKDMCPNNISASNFNHWNPNQWLIQPFREKVFSLCCHTYSPTPATFSGICQTTAPLKRVDLHIDVVEISLHPDPAKYEQGYNGHTFYGFCLDQVASRSVIGRMQDEAYRLQTTHPAYARNSTTFYKTGSSVALRNGITNL